jgi:exonuclease VII small subunit
MTKKKEGVNLSKNLKELAKIADWFEGQEDLDIEDGLKKVREAVGLIKESKKRLEDVENEFEEIKREVEDVAQPRAEEEGTPEEVDRPNTPF